MFESSRWPVWTMTVSLMVVIIIIIVSALNITRDNSVDTYPSAGSRTTSSLQFVIVVSRHGNRRPLDTFPTYPYNDKAFWPFGEAQLTMRGRLQMFALGRKIRTLYNGFLGENYSPGVIRGLSTLKDRTMMSAQLFLTGLFPPKGFTKWKKEFPWQPIPVYPNYLDHTPDYTLCPRYVNELGIALARYKKETEENSTEILKSTTKYTGKSFTADTLPNYIFSIQDALYSADIEGLSLPAWSKSVYPEPISSLRANYLKEYVMGSDTITRLYQGTLFQEIMNTFQGKMDASINPEMKMMYYSGHDTTVLGLQAILGQLNSEIKLINSASALILELHNDTQSNDHYIQALFIDGGSKDLEPKLVEIPRCGINCSFGILKSITEKFYNITDYAKECRTDVKSGIQNIYK